MKKIGVLALQGDFSKHMKTLTAAGACGVEVRESSDIEKIDGLILPGGESTTIGKLLERYRMIEPLKQFAAAGKPIYGTCAGGILLAKNIEKYNQVKLDLLDITIARNAYGRQIESFEADIPAPSLGELPLRGVFIRAPVITRMGKGVELIAQFGGSPVFIRQGNIIVTTFHPELTDDLRVHRFFLSLAQDGP
ncbi:MAG: pyridoxal 5'-phosphate synthase glutaminase subunit PdxT [Spirochaetales bacterium]|jgi:5'-phosphate synthase pdxT subunit|nr:pyridoxal 5'-phosphate synthase glutaminase subunit PdxT [Spirochaetales bacterium]